MKQLIKCLLFMSLVVLTLQDSEDDYLCMIEGDGYPCKNNNYCFNNKCVHKPLFPMSTSDVYFTTILFIGSVLAILCGSAGGLFYVPLMINILTFEFKDAVPISKSFILTKNTIMLIYYLKKQHPIYKTTLINLNNFVQILPTIYIGISIGYIFYIIFPAIILSTVFCIVIGFLVINVFKKSYERFLHENEILKNENRNTNASSNTQIHYNRPEYELVNASEDDPLVNSISSKNLKAFEDIHSEYFFFYKICLCIISVFTFMIFLFLNGSSSSTFLKIQICSSSYWFLYTSGIIIQVVIAICIAIILNRETRHIVNNDLTMGVVKFTYSNCLLFIGLGFVVGLISITFGLAGGFMANPFFIMIGFDPLISVATATGIMEISSSSSLFKFIVNVLKSLMIRETFSMTMLYSIVEC